MGKVATIISALTGISALAGGMLYVGELKGRVDTLDSKAIEEAHKMAVDDIDSRLANVDAIDGLVNTLQRDVRALNARISAMRDDIVSIKRHLEEYRIAFAEAANHESFSLLLGHRQKNMIPVGEGFCYLDGFRLRDSNVESSAYVYVNREIGYWVLGSAHERDEKGNERTKRNTDTAGAGVQVDKAYANCVRYPATD